MVVCAGNGGRCTPYDQGVGGTVCAVGAIHPGLEVEMGISGAIARGCPMIERACIGGVRACIGRPRTVNRCPVGDQTVELGIEIKGGGGANEIQGFVDVDAFLGDGIACVGNRFSSILQRR